MYTNLKGFVGANGLINIDIRIFTATLSSYVRKYIMVYSGSFELVRTNGYVPYVHSNVQYSFPTLQLLKKNNQH